MIILIDSGVLGQLCRPSLDRETLLLDFRGVEDLVAWLGEG
jgi:hypothetical protein